MTRQITPDPEILNRLRNDAAEYVRWANFGSSEFGKYFLQWLENAIIETVHEEDKFNIYDKAEHHILYHLAAVRSKRQTLRALKEKIVVAEQKGKELAEELHRID